MAEADLNKSINYLQLSMCVRVCKLQLLNNVISEASASITFNYFSQWCVRDPDVAITTRPGEPGDPGAALREGLLHPPFQAARGRAGGRRWEQ